MNSYLLNDILVQIQYYEKLIVTLLEKKEQDGIKRRYALKEHKKNVKTVKHNIFLIKTSPTPNETYINEFKNKLLLLKEEEKIIWSKFSNLYVETVSKLENCYSKRLDFYMLLRYKRYGT